MTIMEVVAHSCQSSWISCLEMWTRCETQPIYRNNTLTKRLIHLILAYTSILTDCDENYLASVTYPCQLLVCRHDNQRNKFIGKLNLASGSIIKQALTLIWPKSINWHCLNNTVLSTGGFVESSWENDFDSLSII